MAGGSVSLTVLRRRLVHRAYLKQPLLLGRADGPVRNGVQPTLRPSLKDCLQSTTSSLVLCLQVVIVLGLMYRVFLHAVEIYALGGCCFLTGVCLCAEYTTWRAVPSYYGAGRGTVTAVPHENQSEPIQFTKICRPTAYRASVRNGEVQKLVKSLAATSSSKCCTEGCSRLQQSSHSAFRMLKPQQAVEA